MRPILAVVISVWIVGCSTSSPTPAPHRPASSPDLTFVVRVSGKLPLENVTGVRVTGIAADGHRIEFGKTFGGRLTVRKEQLREHDLQVILFCHPAFRCSAYDIAAEAGETGPALFEFDEWSVDLAPIVLY